MSLFAPLILKIVSTEGVRRPGFVQTESKSDGEEDESDEPDLLLQSAVLALCKFMCISKEFCTRNLQVRGGEWRSVVCLEHIEKGQEREGRRVASRKTQSRAKLSGGWKTSKRIDVFGIRAGAAFMHAHVCVHFDVSSTTLPMRSLLPALSL